MDGVEESARVTNITLSEEDRFLNVNDATLSKMLGGGPTSVLRYCTLDECAAKHVHKNKIIKRGG